jgi:hypothetical protein
MEEASGSWGPRGGCGRKLKQKPVDHSLCDQCHYSGCDRNKMTQSILLNYMDHALTFFAPGVSITSLDKELGDFDNKRNIWPLLMSLVCCLTPQEDPSHPAQPQLG